MAFSFFGGVHPKDHKDLSRLREIRVLPAPSTLVIPMVQHIGAPCTPLVKKGDQVLMGQKIGDGQGLCVPVHSSVSGVVKSVGGKPHSNGTTVMSVVITNDEQYTPDPSIQPRESIDDLTPDDLISIIREAGIVGMGGATFPTHVKLSSGLGKVDTVILNGSECEPYITADERLLYEECDRCIAGLEIIMKILSLDHAVIALEDNKPHTAKALAVALDDHPNITLQLLKARYPQGAEKQLIQAVTGRQVPPGGLPAQVGCAVFNAATCAAICDAVWDGIPLIQRVVTVSGDVALDPKNLLVSIGTPFTDLMNAVGNSSVPHKVLAGGPMMGVAQFDLSVPVIKGCNAVTMLHKDNSYAPKYPHCIRCGKCIDVCPMHLMPLKMYSAERRSDIEGMKSLNLFDCMECGCCAYTCPAGIPLVQSFRAGKQKIKNATPPPQAGK